MADDAKLLAVIDANTKAFENALKRVERQTNQTFGKAERSVKRLDASLNAGAASAARIGRSLTRNLLGPLAAIASARGIAQAADSFNRIQNSLRIVGLEGDKAAAVFDRLFDAAQRNAAPVEALVDLFKVGSLAQKELNVSSEELIRFTEGVAAALRVSGKTAEESRGALLQLSQAIGGVVVRAEEFNSIQEGALPIVQAVARGLEEAGGSVTKLKGLIINGKVSSEAFFQAFRAGQGVLEQLASTSDLTLGQSLTVLQNSFTKLIGKLDDTTNASGALTTGMGGLARAMDALPGIVDAFQDKLDELNTSNSFLNFLIVTNEEAEAFTKRLAEMQAAADATARSTSMKSIEAEIIELQKQIDFMQADTTSLIPNIAIDTAIAKLADLKASLQELTRINIKGGPLAGTPAGRGSIPTTVSITQFPPPPKTGGGGGRVAAVSDIELQEKAVEQLISDLAFENRLIGMTNVQREIEIALRRAGVTAASDQGKAITQLVATGVREQELLDALIDRMDELRSTAGDVLSSFNDALRDGQGLAGGLKSALESVLDTLIRIAEQKAIEGLFGAFGTAGGGGGIGAIIGRLFGGAAQGGAAPARFATMALPTAGGMRTAGTAGGQATAVVHLMIDENQMFASRVVGISGAVAVQAVRSNNRGIPGMIASQRARGLA